MSADPASQYTGPYAANSQMIDMYEDFIRAPYPPMSHYTLRQEQDFRQSLRAQTPFDRFAQIVSSGGSSDPVMTQYADRWYSLMRMTQPPPRPTSTEFVPSHPAYSQTEILNSLYHSGFLHPTNSGSPLPNSFNTIVGGADYSSQIRNMNGLGASDDKSKLLLLAAIAVIGYIALK